MWGIGDAVFSPQMRTLLALVIVVAASSFAQGSIFPDEKTKKAAKQLEPANVSEESRAFLKTKMKNHNKEMKELSIAVATVKLTEVQRLAQDIANQPRLDATTGPAAKLPPRFFELQEELKTNAQALADAAKANEMSNSEAKYAQVMGTCMACHAAFKK